mmetsp:Transcript_58811/g.129101  ORF Transcript_58811/g.129101 Transcript_58811/m.129101 type:complete len:111 (+) Transcript_58811:842-1174(+)
MGTGCEGEMLLLFVPLGEVGGIWKEAMPNAKDMGVGATSHLRSVPGGISRFGVFGVRAPFGVWDPVGVLAPPEPGVCSPCKLIARARPSSWCPAGMIGSCKLNLGRSAER